MADCTDADVDELLCLARLLRQDHQSNVQRQSFLEVLDDALCNRRDSIVIGQQWFLGIEEVNILADALHRHRYVTGLDLNCWACESNEQQAILLESLKASALQELYLEGFRDSYLSGAALASALRESSLRRLLLDRSWFGAKTMSELTTALKGSALTHLSLEWCTLDDASYRALTAALPSCSLSSLSLRGSRFNDEGTEALASVLADSKLEWLDLSDNTRITDEGGRALLEALPRSFMDFLALDGSQCSDELLTQISTALERNRERTFVLQVQVVFTGTSSEVELICRTVAGTVAAIVLWGLEQCVEDLPQMVMATMSASGFVLPFKYIKAAYLRLLLPNGNILQVKDEAGPLGQQLALDRGQVGEKKRKKPETN
jgi:hypothetical protein